MARSQQWQPKPQDANNDAPSLPDPERFANKAYKAGIQKLEKNTCVRSADLDDVAIKYLDYLQDNGGRAEQALEHLENAVKSRTREQVSKWTEYSWKLLKTFDPVAHKAVKELREADRLEKRKAKRSAGYVVPAPATPFTFNAEAPEFKPTLNVDAPEFVPSSAAATTDEKATTEEEKKETGQSKD
eukprot:TRINITY_DN744_c0_g1_i2.p1 TRINITY_DN744_c0_g1~~TRINITY_DN744_c0_g1_i2.p1  ORF type:complete len:218 (+),score=62.38 TRINITY_DN744_c0_g1_i2:97-654(+)